MNSNIKKLNYLHEKRKINNYTDKKRKINNYTNKTCNFCHKKGHTSRNCKAEKNISAQIKEETGTMWEHWYAENNTCINCNRNTLKVLNNRTPSLDIKCDFCEHHLEIKSKGLSANNIPTDLYLNHGSYKHYINRQKNGLDIAIIIYGINRKTKEDHFEREKNKKNMFF